MVKYLQQGAAYGFWSAPRFEAAARGSHTCHILDDISLTFYDNNHQRVADFHYKHGQGNDADTFSKPC